MSLDLPDYFEKPSSEEEIVLRRVKGNIRKILILKHLEEEPLETVPEHWKQHNLPEELKAEIQSYHPQARGGEDLPDLLPEEVEIARLSLVDSVHGEVTSLRARPGKRQGEIELRMVDEYGTEFIVEKPVVSRSQTAEEVLDIFRNTKPSPLQMSECQFTFASPFYDDLDEIAMDLGLMQQHEI